LGTGGFVGLGCAFGGRAELGLADRESAPTLSAQAEAGNVFLVKAPWNWDYINEITTFPNAAHDDQWDGTSGAFNHLARPKTVSAYTSKSKAQEQSE